MDAGAVSNALRELDNIVCADDFKTVMKRFVDSHCDNFTDAIESKHEHHDVYKAFVALCDEYLMAKLKERIPTLKEEKFFAALPEYLKGEHGAESGAVLDVLMALTDFLAFRNMMVAAKRDRDRATVTPAPLDEGTIPPLPPGAEPIRAELEKTVLYERDNKFVVTDKRPWLEVAKRVATDGRGLMWRVTAVLDVPPAAMVRMSFDWELRRKWDDSITSVEPLGESGPFRTAKIERKLAFFPLRPAYVRIGSFPNYPEVGSTTLVAQAGTTPPDAPPPAAGKAEGMTSVAVVRGDASSPARCRVTSFVAIDAGVPQFIVSLMGSAMMSRMYAKVEVAYKSLRAAGSI